MAWLSTRNLSVVLCCAALQYACGGNQFNAGGVAGSAGASTSGGSSGKGGGSANGGSATSGGSATAGEAGTGATAGDAGSHSGGSSAGGSSAGGSSAGGAGGVSTGGTGGTSTGGAGGVSTGGSGGVRNSGDCLVDKDCPAGGTCAPLSVGGFRTCVLPVPPPSGCSKSDACCPGLVECATGSTCVEGPLAPSCGLPVQMAPVCAKKECASAADCSGNNAICVPAGALGRKANTCLSGGCRRDVDCKDLANGKCEPVTSACCEGPTGLFCVYPGKGCRSNADCASGSTCQIVNDKTGECVSGPATCAL